MSADATVQAAMLAALRDAAAFGGALNGVFDGAPGKATPPYAELGEMLVTDWGTKDLAGRELRTLLTIRDLAEQSDRLQALANAAEAALDALPRLLPGWQLVSVALVRRRVLRAGPGKWSALVEHRLRVLAR